MMLVVVALVGVVDVFASVMFVLVALVGVVACSNHAYRLQKLNFYNH